MNSIICRVALYRRSGSHLPVATHYALGEQVEIKGFEYLGNGHYNPGRIVRGTYRAPCINSAVEQSTDILLNQL